MALQGGANVAMPNVTEGEYRRLYELYPGKAGSDQTPAHNFSAIGQKIMSTAAKSEPVTAATGELLKMRNKVLIYADYGCSNINILESGLREYFEPAEMYGRFNRCRGDNQPERAG